MVQEVDIPRGHNPQQPAAQPAILRHREPAEAARALYLEHVLHLRSRRGGEGRPRVTLAGFEDATALDRGNRIMARS